MNLIPLACKNINNQYLKLWSQPVSAIIDIADLEENPTEGEWAFN